MAFAADVELHRDVMLAFDGTAYRVCLPSMEAWASRGIEMPSSDVRTFDALDPALPDVGMMALITEPLTWANPALPLLLMVKGSELHKQASFAAINALRLFGWCGLDRTGAESVAMLLTREQQIALGAFLAMLPEAQMYSPQGTRVVDRHYQPLELPAIWVTRHAFDSYRRSLDLYAMHQHHGMPYPMRMRNLRMNNWEPEALVVEPGIVRFPRSRNQRDLRTLIAACGVLGGYLKGTT